jgi:hypothetical protein
MVSRHRWSIGRSGFPMWGALVMVCVATLPMASDQQAQVVVVSVTGDWTSQDAKGDCKAAGKSRRPVRFGEMLTAGAMCLIGNEGDSIVLKSWSPTDDLLYPCHCQREDLDKKNICVPLADAQKGCAVDLRKLGEKKAFLATFFDTISEAFTRMTRSQPDKYMVAASRGAEPELVDAVVPIENGQIDVQAIFREMDPGTYYLELAAVGAPSFSGPPSRVTFAKGQAARVEARGVRAGLYKLTLVTEKSEPGDSDCWVLVAESPEYAKQAAAYERAASESTKLPKEMDAGATRALLRAYLESLANPKQGTAVRP